ncbi:hypothetical protein F444_12711, partial [Phytophthora nicotianae P1976]
AAYESNTKVIGDAYDVIKAAYESDTEDISAAFGSECRTLDYKTSGYSNEDIAHKKTVQRPTVLPRYDDLPNSSADYFDCEKDDEIKLAAHGLHLVPKRRGD